jgi:hypothetical protein
MKDDLVPPVGDADPASTSCDTDPISCLPPIPFKKAFAIDLRFRFWTSLLAIWLFFGFFWGLKHCSDRSNYDSQLAKVRLANSSLSKVKPEFEETVRKLQNHLGELSNLNYYMMVSDIMSLGAWIMLFPTRKKFVNRKPEAPRWLITVLGVQLAADGLVALQTWGIPATDVSPIINLDVLRIQPFVRGAIMLTILPLLNRFVPTYCRYVALDEDVFKRPGAVWRFLTAQEAAARKAKIVARRRRAIKALIAYVSVAVVLLMVILLDNSIGQSGLTKFLLRRIVVVAAGVALWTIVETTLLATILCSSAIVVALGGLITCGIASAITIPVLLRQATRETTAAS